MTIPEKPLEVRDCLECGTYTAVIWVDEGNAQIQKYHPGPKSKDCVHCRLFRVEVLRKWYEKNPAI